MAVSSLLLRLLFGRRLPQIAGELRVRGPQQPITIRRDKWGVPCIEAETDFDAIFGLGFCHGQDRAFQLEVLLRVSRGTLAELVGPRGVPADRMSRRIGFRRAADMMLLACDPDVQEVLRAYTAGVNAGATVGLARPPHELAILRAQRTEWEPADVLAFTKLQSFLLPSNWDAELARLRILRADGPEALRQLDPIPPEWLPAVEESMNECINELARKTHTTTHSEMLSALAHDLALFQQFAPRGSGSNNWTIAGSRTVSGKPVLACDPHLAPTIPPPWYLAHIRTPSWAVAGATFAGSPVFPIGHNGFACWGITAALTDNTDLFLETIGPDGSSVRESDGTYYPCEIRREIICVKGGPEVIEEVLLTPRGPIVTPLASGVTEAVSIRAMWLEPLPLRGFFDASRAKSFDEFRRAFAKWPVLPLNIVYADVAGTIGWQLAGQLPQRKSGFGTIPLPADAPEVGWEADPLAFDAMPYLVDPPSGFIVTANNPINKSDCVSGRVKQNPIAADAQPNTTTPTVCFYGQDFVDGYRAAVITEELSQQTGWDVPACLALQRNVRSKPWEELRDIVLALQPTDVDAQYGMEVLRSWDGHASVNSSGATVFELFVSELCVRVAKAKAPRSWQVVLGGPGSGPFEQSLFADRRVGHLVRLLRTRPPGWFNRDWEAELADVLATVVRRLRASAGPAAAYWGWGHLRTLVLRHPLFGGVRRLAGVFNVGPVPIGGDMNTVLQAGAAPLRPTDPTHNFPNLRAVFDTANWSNSRFVLAGGQSGNPFSANYADQFPLWQRGEAIPIAWEPADIIRSAVASLRLTP
jgi:penicillin amidase